jgi:hypothetical protein
MNKEPTGMVNGLTNDGNRDFSVYLRQPAIRAPIIVYVNRCLHQQCEVEQW